MTKNYLAVCCVLLVLAAASPTASAANGQSPVVGVQAFGASYGEWSARWWQWVLSIPVEVNPALDRTGVNCAQGQVDDVWFLAGTFDGSATRTCTVPAGKAIFFPVINIVAAKPWGYESLLDLRRTIGGIMDAVTSLECTIDGVAVPNLSKFRVRSPSFTVISRPGGLIPPGFLKAPANTDQMVSDGYWLLLSPLPPGLHVIRLHAENSFGYVVDATYNLNID